MLFDTASPQSRSFKVFLAIIQTHNGYVGLHKHRCHTDVLHLLFTNVPKGEKVFQNTFQGPANSISSHH